MLSHVKIGRVPEPHTLVITPEFLDVLKKMNHSCGVYLRTRFYPLARNWLVLSGVPVKHPPVVAFSVKNKGETIPIFIPMKQCRIFEGKLLGRAMDVVSSPVGFLEV